MTWQAGGAHWHQTMFSLHDSLAYHTHKEGELLGSEPMGIIYCDRAPGQSFGNTVVKY